MKKQQTVMIVFLILLSICTFAVIYVKAQASPTVSVTPSPVTIDVGQSQVFTVTVSGGSGDLGTLSYQWSVNGATQADQTATTFSFTATSAGSFLIEAEVTGSYGIVGVPTAGVTVNPALVAPAMTANPVIIDQFQTSVFNTVQISGGSGPYDIQTLEKAPGATSYSDVGQNLSNFSFVTSSSTIPGVWSFEVQVTDSTGAVVTSNVATVTVNSELAAPTAAANPSIIDPTQTSTLTSAAVTTGTAPYTYQWMEHAPNGGGVYSMVGSNSASYSFATSDSTIPGVWSFEVQVTDSTGAEVTSYAATVTVNPPPSVTVSPSNWTTPVGQSVTFTATASGGSGTYTSYQWYVNNGGGPVLQTGYTASTFPFSFSPGDIGSRLITATVTDSLGVTSAMSSPSAAVTVSTPVTATTANGTTVDLAISGNVTNSQMSNVAITADKSAATTTVSFTVTGVSGTIGFGNVTVPKSAVPYGTTPTIYIDGVQATYQGYTQDADNYYLWYITHFSTHRISIVFTETSPSLSSSSSSSPSVPEFPSVITVIAMLIAATSASIYSRKNRIIRNQIERT